MHNQLIILGGMGPQASLRLHELLLQKSRQFHDGSPDEYPSILHASLQIPDFIASTKNTERAKQIIRENCALLPLDSALAIGLACNTAHMLLDDLPLRRSNFVSMIDAVVEDIVASRATSVGLLASPHTLRTKLYEKALLERGVAVVLPSTRERETLNEIIHDVIAGEDIQPLRLQLTKIATQLHARGADSMLLGCTELPLVGIEINLPVVDSLSSLADAMLRKIKRSKV